MIKQTTWSGCDARFLDASMLFSMKPIKYQQIALRLPAGTGITLIASTRKVVSKHPIFLGAKMGVTKALQKLNRVGGGEFWASSICSWLPKFHILSVLWRFLMSTCGSWLWIKPSHRLWFFSLRATWMSWLWCGSIFSSLKLLGPASYEFQRLLTLFFRWSRWRCMNSKGCLLSFPCRPTNYYK